MAKKQPNIDWKRPRLENKSFLLAGKLQPIPRKPISSHVSGDKSPQRELKAAIQREGGEYLEKFHESVNYLIVGAVQNKTSQSLQQRVARLKSKGALIELLDEQQFYDLFKPTSDETLAMLRSGNDGWIRWRELSSMPWEQHGKVDLRKRDLRDLVVRGGESENMLDLGGLLLDGADLRGATLANTYVNYVKKAKFDGANLEGTFVAHCEDCSFKKVNLQNGVAEMMTRCLFDDAQFGGWSSRFSAQITECRGKRIDLTGTRLNPVEIKGGDFTKAVFRVKTGSYTRAEDVVFAGADCREAELRQSKFLRCDCQRADFSEARLDETDFSHTNLAKAKFVRADLARSTFNGADLSKADFSESNLIDADLRGANITGANFKDANLAGAKLDGLDLSKAKNLQVESLTQVTVGPHVKQLEQVAKQSRKLQTSAELVLPAGTVDVSVSSQMYSTMTSVSGYFCHHPTPKQSRTEGVRGRTIPTAMIDLVKRWPKGKLVPNSIEVSASKCPIKRKELIQLATAAWHEVFGIDVLSDENFEQQQQEEKERQASLAETLLKELYGGPEGVKKWNARPHKERDSVTSLLNQDFSGKKLKGVFLPAKQLQKSKFDKADLSDAKLNASQLKNCSFRDANLRRTNLAHANASEADFRGAKLTGSWLVSANFRGASFVGADLTKATLVRAKLLAADLSEAKLTDVEWAGATFDEKTKFPQGFTTPDDLVWKGEGPDPRVEARIVALPKAEKLDFDQFLQRLDENVEKARLQKATAMLKAERFQLYSKSTKEHVIGVVKSQSSPDLVYSCRLAKGGHFACCSQNLNPCGGLRGALCKHLLVLVIGLCKSGELDPGQVESWIRASQFRSPELDGDAMSEALLQYKGAESGEIDWRPTETIPEDFYAL